MKYKLTFLLEARADSEEIRQYLAQYYESTVKKFFEKLKKRTTSLKSNPFLDQIYLERPAYRQLAADDYLVFYKVHEHKKYIEIHRILHCSRDIERYIQ
jgi:plasmid stabilization system protein ParE